MLNIESSLKPESNCCVHVSLYLHTWPIKLIVILTLPHVYLFSDWLWCVRRPALICWRIRSTWRWVCLLSRERKPSLLPYPQTSWLPSSTRPATTTSAWPYSLRWVTSSAVACPPVSLFNLSASRLLLPPSGDHGVPGYEHQDSAQPVQWDVQAPYWSHHPGHGHRTGPITQLLR